MNDITYDWLLSLTGAKTVRPDGKVITFMYKDEVRIGKLDNNSYLITFHNQTHAICETKSDIILSLEKLGWNKNTGFWDSIKYRCSDEKIETDRLQDVIRRLECHNRRLEHSLTTIKGLCEIQTEDCGHDCYDYVSPLLIAIVSHIDYALDKGKC